jgi:hypothetical protein
MVMPLTIQQENESLGIPADIPTKYIPILQLFAVRD